MSDHAISLIAGAAPAARHSGRAQRDPESAQALAGARWARPAECLSAYRSTRAACGVRVCSPANAARFRTRFPRTVPEWKPWGRACN